MKNNSLIPAAEEILTDLGLGHLPSEQKEQIIKGLMSHLSEIVIETFSDNITEDQAKELQSAIEKDPDKAQENIAEIASRTPALYDKISLAIKQELEILKYSYENLK